MSWVGGKKALRDTIVARLPEDCDRYVEVFGGGGWVLFYKHPHKFEVYNDFNPNLANLYRCVRDHPAELCDALTYTLNSRTDFEHIREVLHSKTVIPDIKRAAYFYQIIRESYASGLDSYGAQPHNMWRNFPLIHRASERLQSVVVENKDFEKLISQYDRPNTIFYLDPPYFETEDYYKDIGKAIILGCTSKQTPSEIDGCISTIRSLYKPHRDYDSSMCLAHSISSDLAGIEAHINHKGALTRQETEDVHASLLRIAGNCFRQCGTIMRESHEAEMHGLTISQ